jgi:polyisoprenoid-binding protein YceI
LFPDASFSLTGPVDFGALPADGEEITVDAIGDLTIHGVTRSETIALTAQLQGDVIVVFGQLGPILLADYDISEPRAAVVLSVEDNAIMELQLFFSRS